MTIIRNLSATAAVMAAVFSPLPIQAQEEIYPNSYEYICSAWAAQAIDVPNGGQQPDIAKLISAVDKVWPSSNSGLLRSAIKSGRIETLIDEDTDLKVIVDRKNGYFSIEDAGTDSEGLSACVWRRTNGHRLLAVSWVRPTDPEVIFATFYDYNPATQKLTPDLKPLQLLSPYSNASYRLPRKGTDLHLYVIKGMHSDDEFTFKWDGMNFKPTTPLPADVLPKNDPLRSGIKWLESTKYVDKEDDVVFYVILNYLNAEGKKQEFHIQSPLPISPNEYVGGSIEEKDINFDGIPDVQVFVGYLQTWNGHNPISAALVWNPYTHGFYDSYGYSNIVNPVVDAKKKLIYGTEIGDGYTINTTYMWLNGYLTRISETTEQDSSQ